MGKLRFLGCLLVCVLLWPVSPAWGEESPTANPKQQPKVNFFNTGRQYSRPVLSLFKKLGVQFTMDFLSRYVWNGLAYSRGPVWQPSASLEFHGVGVSVLGNFVLNDEPNQGQFNEVDFTLYYGITAKKLEIDTSFTFSIYPNDNPASLNFSKDSLYGNLHLAYPAGPIDVFTDLSIWVFQPNAAVFWDLGIGYQRDLPLNFSLSTSALFGMANGKYNRGFVAPGIGSGPSVFSYSLAFPYSPVKGLIFTPQFNFSTLLTQAVRTAAPYATNIWGDLTIGYNF